MGGSRLLSSKLDDLREFSKVSNSKNSMKAWWEVQGCCPANPISDEEEERVGAMSLQEVMDHKMMIEAREKGDPIDILIERGCKRVSEENVDKVVRDNESCQICQEEYSGPCFSFSVLL